MKSHINGINFIARLRLFVSKCGQILYARKPYYHARSPDLY